MLKVVRDRVHFLYSGKGRAFVLKRAGLLHDGRRSMEAGDPGTGLPPSPVHGHDAGTPLDARQSSKYTCSLLSSSCAKSPGWG